MNQLKWETVIAYNDGEGTYRLAVPGGWILKVVDATLRPATISLCFIPDSDHIWDINLV
jgi:hypothetical protein